MLKEEGIRKFLKEDFFSARTLFSLAYEQDKNEDTLFLIKLCDLASQNVQEAQELLYSYLVKKEDSFSLDKKTEEEYNSKDKNDRKAISYRELSQLLEEGNFEDILELLNLNASLIVQSKEELFDLINQAIEKKSLNFAYSLLEKATSILDDKTVKNLLRKIENYENKL